MLCKRIIPCLDVTGGRVVKGINFVQLRDAGDPVEIAQRYDAAGADELAFLDITASSDDRDILVHLIEAVAARVFIPLTVGGGVRSVADVRRLLNAGADKVSINSAALANPDLINEASAFFGSQAIVVAIDARCAVAGGAASGTTAPGGNAVGGAEPGRIATDGAADPAGSWQVYSHGGRRPVGRDALAWAVEASHRGAGEILLTSMDRDGTRAGFDLALTRAVSDAVRVPVIASGGVGCLQHLVEGVLEGHADAVLAASIFHFGEVSIAQAKAHMAAQGLAIRPV